MAWQHSQTELHAWAAGIFESGGHMSKAQISLSTHDPEIVDDLRLGFGGERKDTVALAAGKPGTTYKWSLSDKPAIVRFLQSIRPFLHKRRQTQANAIFRELI